MSSNRVSKIPDFKYSWPDLISNFGFLGLIVWEKQPRMSEILSDGGDSSNTKKQTRTRKEPKYCF